LGESTILCGNQKLLTRYNVAVPKEDMEDAGTEVFVAKDKIYAGRILINDLIKQDSKDAIRKMTNQGLYTAMLTGDTLKNAQAVQQATGIHEVFARQMPQDKLANLEKIRQEHGAVMFIGDGINDAPVLAGADVGAAMGSGADAAIEAADVVFMTSRLTALVESFRIAKATGRIAKENVVFALVVKAAIMVMGLCGIASMWMAVFADSGVAMICVLNSIRILYRKNI
jgi:Cd2+/Zn2+-exporting ATPase